MQRVTITLDDELSKEVDRLVEKNGYQNRSEAMRDFVRLGIQQARQDEGVEGNCVAAVAYVYDHSARDLPKRLIENVHGHHDLSLATLHVHLSNDSCMEVTVLRGQSGEVRHVADHIIAERGVRYGRVVIIPSDQDKRRRPRKRH